MSEGSTTTDLVELVRGFWASAARRDWDAILCHYAPDAVWDFSPLGLGTYEDQPGMRGLWQEWVDAYSELELDVEEALDVGNGVVLAVVRQTARPVGSTGQLHLTSALVYAWSGDMVVRVTTYLDIDEARAAAERLAEERGKAMSQANVEIVRDMLGALEHGGVGAMTEFLHPEITWRAIEGAPDDVGEMSGRQAFRRYAQDWFEMFDDFSVVPEELLDVGDGRVVAVQRISGRAKLSGIETELRYAVIYTLRDGKIVGGREYAHRLEAIEAAGLR
jgi:ketosteroid isomerase-like protein